MENSKSGAKNYVTVGTTGNGKSHTCNTITRSNYFKVSDEMISCTKNIEEFYDRTNNRNIFDIPGFNDNRLDESEIDNVLSQLTNKIINLPEMSSNQIDGFILVQMGTPRLSTLKNDIEKMRDFFGSESLKSIVIVVIENYEGYEKKDDDKFYKEFQSMTECIKILEENKKQKFSNDWVIRWNNKTPRENQEKKLFDSFEKVEPYTHEKFIYAQEEIKKRNYEKNEAEIRKRTKEIEEQYKNDKIKQDDEIKKLKEISELNNKNFEQRLKEIANNNQALIDYMNRSNEQQTRILRENYNEMRNLYEKSQEAFNYSNKNEKSLQNEISNLSSQIEKLKRQINPQPVFKPINPINPLNRFQQQIKQQFKPIIQKK